MRVGRPVVARHPEPLLGEVDRDDPARVREPAPDDRAEADEPAAEHDAGRAGLDLGRVERRSDSGREPARERRTALERRLGRDLRQRDLREHRVLGERGRAHEVAQRLAAPGEARRAVREVAEPLLVADRDAAVGARIAAVLALAALRRKESDDVVARPQRRDVLADGLDDARALVTEDARHVAARIGARGRVQVRVADAAGDEADERLSRLRLGEVHVLDDERLPELLEHCGADPHAAPSVDAGRRLSPGCHPPTRGVQCGGATGG